MHHRELIKDFNMNIQDILVSSNLKIYGSFIIKRSLTLVKVMIALMNQWSNRIFIANILSHLEGSFTLSRILLVFKENMMIKIKTKNQTKSCLRTK